MVQYMLYNWDVPLEKVKEFVKPFFLVPSYDLRDKDLPREQQRIEMWHIASQYGLCTIKTNSYIVKTDDDVFVMSKDSFNELLIDEIENIE